MKVSEILKQENTPLVTVKGNVTIQNAAHRMKMEKVGCVIISEDGKKPEGIVAVRDVVYNMVEHWGDSPDGSEFSYLMRPVSEIMKSPVKTCNLDHQLRDVLHMMWHWHFLHIPVLDGSRGMCGIVSIDDVIKFSTHEMEMESRVLHERLMLRNDRPMS